VKKSTVFIADCYVLNEIFDQVTTMLQSQGIEVVRGPATTPGKKLVYPKELYTELFSQAEVMMFSSRSICSRDIMLAAPRLRGIVNPTIGVETVDLDAASELGILVGHGAIPEIFLSMAESTVMLMLMLLYNPKTTEEVLRGVRPRPAPSQSWQSMMFQRTIGMIGFGRIARNTAERLTGFGVRIIAYDPYIKPESVPPHVTMVDLETLLKTSDIVGLFVTITSETRNMIGAKELDLMKPTAVLVNISRGEAIDEDALYLALKEKRIAGAALDTFVVEPLPQDSPLRQLENAILTPHLMGHTHEVFSQMPIAAVENITCILRGEVPPYCKNPEAIPSWNKRLAQS
jgi:phosphoglycerate dehydrogenase-like enzyme